MIRRTSKEMEDLRADRDQLQAAQEEPRISRAEAEADLHRYQELFEFAPDGYLVTNRHGRIKEANLAAARILNVPPRFFIDKPLTVYVDPAGRSRLFALMQSLLSDDQAEAVLRIIPRGSQEPRIIQARVTADRFLGEPPHTLRWLLRDITRQQQELVAARERQQEMASKLALVEEQERRRIAMQIHDNITQSLAVAQLRLGMLRAELPPEHSKTVDEVRAELAQALSQIRTLTFELSPAILYEFGLGAAIEWLIEQRSGCGVEFEFQDELAGQRFRRDIEITLFQAARELIVNILRHSHATRASLSLRHESSQLVMEVADNGVGFNPPPRPFSSAGQTGLGLPSLRERLSHLRGSLEVISAPGGGTRVRITAPLRKVIAQDTHVEEPDATPSAYRRRPSDLSSGPQVAVGEGGGPASNGGGRRRPRRLGNNGNQAR